MTYICEPWQSSKSSSGQGSLSDRSAPERDLHRRRKKVTPQSGETLVESAAKSQSDKRFATSWKNLVVDIEKAAKLANQHGSKPSNLSDEEWAMV